MQDEGCYFGKCGSLMHESPHFSLLEKWGLSSLLQILSNPFADSAFSACGLAEEFGHGLAAFATEHQREGQGHARDGGDVFGSEGLPSVMMPPMVTMVSPKTGSKAQA